MTNLNKQNFKKLTDLLEEIHADPSMHAKFNEDPVSFLKSHHIQIDILPEDILNKIAAGYTSSSPYLEKPMDEIKFCDKPQEY